MSDRPSRPRGRDLSDLDGLITEAVAEALSGGWADGSDPDGVWTRRGSQQTAERRLIDLERARNDTRRLLEGSTYDDGNEFAIGAAENRVDYAVGETGLKYEAVAAPGVAADAALIAEAQAFIDAFCQLNDLPEMERETVWRLDRDGDAAVRLFPADGIPEACFVQPERIYPPADSADRLARAGERYAGCRDEWGVIHDPANRRRVRGYWVDEGGGNSVVVPEAEMCLLKINTTSEWPRGWPTFEPVRRSLIRAEELLVAMTATCKARAKIALVTTIPGWTAAKAEQLVSRLTTRYQDRPGGEAPREQSVEDLPYGANLRVREGTTVTFPPPSLGANEQIEAIQANLRTAAGRIRMPEWMFSGLADQKYANAFVVEAPSLKMFRGLQGKVVTFIGAGRLGRNASVIWKAMRMAVRNGVLRAAVLQAVQIKVTAPNLETRDKGAEASRNKTYIDAKVKSRQTVREEEGLDTATEEQRIEAEAKRYGAGEGGGDKPPAAPPEPPPSPPAPPAEPPVAESLAKLVERWLTGVEGGLARAGEGTFPESAHFGVSGDGERWVSEELIGWLGEKIDRSHLVLKEVQTKGGKVVKRWVRVGAKPGAKSRPPSETQANRLEAAKAFVADPSQLDADSLSTFGDLLTSLPKNDLRDLSLSVGHRVGGTKAKLADRILEHLKARQPAAPASAPSRPPLTAPPKPPSGVTFVGPGGAADGSAPLTDVKARVDAAFGRPVTQAGLAAAANAIDGGRVVVDFIGDAVELRSGDGQNYLALRTIGRDRAGKLRCHNDLFEIEKDRPGPGAQNVNPNIPKGADLLANQVRALREMGVEYIETYAAGSPQQAARGDFVGFKVWPKLGYDAQLDPIDIRSMPPELQAQMGDSRSILDLYKTKAGQDWWAENGHGLEAKFDLTEGSRSMQALEAYLAARDAKRGSSGNGN